MNLILRCLRLSYYVRNKLLQTVTIKDKRTMKCVTFLVVTFGTSVLILVRHCIRAYVLTLTLTLVNNSTYDISAYPYFDRYLRLIIVYYRLRKKWAEGSALMRIFVLQKIAIRIIAGVSLNLLKYRQVQTYIRIQDKRINTDKLHTGHRGIPPSKYRAKI